MAKIIYQELDIPIESKLNSFADEIQENCELLFDKYNIFDEAKKNDFHEQKLTFYASRGFHYASKEVLQILANYFTWGFIFDDYMETHHNEREETCQRVLQIGNGNLCLKEGELLRPLEELFSEIWDSIKQRSPNEWQKRFIDALRNWFVFVHILMNHKVNDTNPTLAEYISYRWFDFGSDMIILMIEFAMQKFLPQSYHKEMVMQHIVHALGNVIASINDIFSYEKETRAGNHLNLVAVIKNEMKIEVQEAMDRAYDFNRVQIQSYFSLRKQLNRIFDPNDEVIKKYVNGMDTLMRGNYDFYFDGNRYFENCPFKSDSTNADKFE
ncbi:pentalenene synthase-like protein [Dinothrombium tinctorium]|uniref:Terpene synthase n=1 Tax=Dinothrombium tinctorium TaxID=1965070 RepID=A0A3S3Q9U1_9ACAR|nr:pentalenene synthase-like protein [Dinothrombium tinctorium]RWS05698.1 pentalenene synthase-like protein [Dinothrombium tinctorium]RWS05702.1 pentalenene synthase-like protein [Dinothrombium tinctorium]RWS05975.1 pentalenene synthase-like protein [Dinothrombium tinctorium]